jgi:hypothetical protein
MLRQLGQGLHCDIPWHIEEGLAAGEQPARMTLKQTHHRGSQVATAHDDQWRFGLQVEEPPAQARVGLAAHVL